jgi:hypothetical protein
MPDGGSIFSGWTGCDSVDGSTCNVTMDTDKIVGATFEAGGGNCNPAVTAFQPVEEAIIARPLISATITSSCGTAIDTASIVMEVDREVVPHTVEGSGSQVVVSYTPTQILLENSFHEVDVTAQDVTGMPLLDEDGQPTGTYNWVFWVPFVY